MNFGMVIRGLNLAETQVHLTGSRLGIRAVDLKEQAVEGIKASQYGACSTPKLFAQLYSNTYEEINVPELVRRLWEDICLDSKTRKLTKRPPHGLVQRGLMEFILEPRYKLFAQVV